MPAGLCFESTKATVLAFHAARDAAHHFVDLSHRVEVARKGNFAIVQIARSSLPPRRREPGAVRLDRRQVEEEWSSDQPRGTLSIRGLVRLRARHSSCIAVGESCVLLVEAPGRGGLRGPWRLNGRGGLDARAV